jgi:hypothetical protein
VKIVLACKDHMEGVSNHLLQWMESHQWDKRCICKSYGLMVIPCSCVKLYASNLFLQGRKKWNTWGKIRPTNQYVLAAQYTFLFGNKKRNRIINKLELEKRIINKSAIWSFVFICVCM